MVTTTLPDLWQTDFTFTPSSAASEEVSFLEQPAHVIPETCMATSSPATLKPVALIASATFSLDVFDASMSTTAWPDLWQTDLTVTPSIASSAVVSLVEHFPQVIPSTTKLVPVAETVSHFSVAHFSPVAHLPSLSPAIDRPVNAKSVDAAISVVLYFIDLFSFRFDGNHRLRGERCGVYSQILILFFDDVFE